MTPEFWCQTTPTEFWCHDISGAKLHFADVAPLLEFDTKSLAPRLPVERILVDDTASLEKEFSEEKIVDAIRSCEGINPRVRMASTSRRFILDGVLIANEMVDYLKKNRSKGLIFKVDFKKARDSLIWRFLIDIMNKIGFGERWCKWVDSCLRSSTMLILVNGSPTEEFCLEREVRQEVSGLRVNYNKSKLYRVGVSDSELRDMARWMRCSVGDFPFTYLGLLIGDNMRRVEVDLEGLGLDFSSSFVGEVGNGRDIRFWTDRWVGGVRLCDRFPRLYHLDRRKEGMMAEKGNWVEGAWCWEWEWVRDLRGRVYKEFEDFQILIQNMVIMFDCRDRWRWTLHKSGDFILKELTKWWKRISKT
ncbi:reverse transcriptase domain, reverse transcriptase zinc-binding domain protein [Tanacetum coccineum]